jgi:hypothetical protein
MEGGGKTKARRGKIKRAEGARRGRKIKMSLEPLYFLAAELRLADLSLSFDRDPSSYGGLGVSAMAEGGGGFGRRNGRKK